MTKIIFEPGSFDDFEGTQSELDAFVAKITELLSSDGFLSKLNDDNIEIIEGDEAEEIREIFNKSSKTIN
jgi:hypothetical protein